MARMRSWEPFCGRWDAISGVNMALSAKQQAFIEHYLQTWNGAESARLAGYSAHTAREQASRMLTNANVQSAIQARLAELKMSADEVLTRLSDHARGSIAPFIRVTPGGDLRGFDLSDDKPLQLLHKLSITTRTMKDDVTEERIALELYDAQAALALLGKHHGLFIDRTEISGPGGSPIRTEVYDYNTAIAAIAARSGEDSDPPGEDASASDGPAVG